MARKSPDRMSSCRRIDGSSKTSFGRRKDAESHARHLEKVFRTGQRLNVYRDGCGRWHVGRARSRKNSGGWK